MTKTIDETGAPQEWKAVFWRYFERRVEPFETLEEAYDYLVYGEEYGELSAVEVIGPDGEVVLSQQQFREAMGADLRGSDLLTSLATQRAVIS